MDYSLFVTDWQPKDDQMRLESLGLFDNTGRSTVNLDLNSSV